MQIRIDRTRCRGAGQCVLSAPGLFDQSEEDGMVVVLESTPPPELRDAARRAAALCPNSVIRIVESEGTADGDEGGGDEGRGEGDGPDAER
ncbi:ferredoxin [Streptomyces lydicus]|uniref:ferredoxin n=1 Tax=Streptomyces lydicus TaxID=47763 RepID=UPI0028704368|nr:ferredoxin [Streptomyces lydicus]